MGTAPISSAQNRGIDSKRIIRGIAQPGDVIIKFSDALHRLSGKATYLHSDGIKYWYSTIASLNKLASDIAAQLDINLVYEAIDDQLRNYINEAHDRNVFDGFHCAPGSSADISDDSTGCRLVVLGVQNSHSSGNNNSNAIKEARDIINHRGTAPRLYKNVLVFLAPDASSLKNLESAARSKLSWEQIVRENQQRNIPPSDLSSASIKVESAKKPLTHDYEKHGNG